MQAAEVECVAATKAVTQLQNVTRDSKTKKQRHSEIFPDHLRAEWKAAMSLRDCTERSRAKKAVVHKFSKVLRDIKSAIDHSMKKLQAVREGRNAL